MLVRIIEFSTNRTRWSTLKDLAKSRAAQLTALAPFIGYLVVYNSELRNYLSLELPESANSSLVIWLKSHSLMDLSRFRAAPIAHSCSFCFEGQGAFPAEG
jgi:hypothetical protein